MSLSNALLKSVLVLSTLTLFVTGCSLSSCKVSPSALSAVPDELKKPVAKVNGAEITRADLDRAKKVLLANKPGMIIPPLLQKEFEVQTLNQLISTELLFQASQKLEIKDLEKQAQEKLAQVKTRFPDPKVYENELKKIGLDEQGLLQSTRRDLAIAYLVNTNIAPNPEVTEAEIKKFYDDNPDKFQMPEMVRASHILIPVDAKAGAEAKKAARAKAEKLRQELEKGADFAKLAQQNSSCPSSKQGGDLGFFPKGKTDPSFEKAAFALQPGALSEVVESKFGYHIIKLLDRKQADKVPFAAAHDSIKGYVKSQKVTSATEQYVSEARKSAKIEMLL